MNKTQVLKAFEKAIKHTRGIGNIRRKALKDSFLYYLKEIEGE